MESIDEIIENKKKLIAKESDELDMLEVSRKFWDMKGFKILSNDEVMTVSKMNAMVGTLQKALKEKDAIIDEYKKDEILDISHTCDPILIKAWTDNNAVKAPAKNRRTGKAIIKLDYTYTGRGGYDKPKSKGRLPKLPTPDFETCKLIYLDRIEKKLTHKRLARKYKLTKNVVRRAISIGLRAFDPVAHHDITRRAILGAVKQFSGRYVSFFRKYNYCMDDSLFEQIVRELVADGQICFADKRLFANSEAI